MRSLRAARPRRIGRSLRHLLERAITLGGLAAARELLPGWKGPRRKAWPTADQIDAVLPQTQCGRCGYPACRPYAEAIARGEADINQCPPGGDAGVWALASLVGRTTKPLDPSRGTVPQEPSVAWIDEAACIGCTRCIQACPVDAILGAAKQMHTVIRSECTGCELCVEPCPVDCISMVPAPQEAPAALLTNSNQYRREPIRIRNQRRRHADLARERYQHRMARLAQEREERQQRHRDKKAMPKRDLDNVDKKAVIQAAVDRARRRQAAMAASRSASSISHSE